MATSTARDDVVFDPRTLRLIVGALAFAFPATVLLLVQRATTSISSSYHEEANRDVFVGFLFIIGALLIAYDGHLQGRAKQKSETVLRWIFSCKWVKVYQEEIVSTIGGAAAILTALYPINRDKYPIDASARIHILCASILFSAVVYFSVVAFPRRVNRKLRRANPAFRKLANTINRIKSRRDVHSFKEFLYRWFPTLSTFFSILSQAITSYDANDTAQIAMALPDRKDKPNKLKYLWLAYEKKLSRGIVYVICGFVIVVTLGSLVYLVVTDPDRVANSIITFKAETIALIAFGTAWMTASQLEYFKQIQNWWNAMFNKETTSVPKQAPTDITPEAAE